MCDGGCACNLPAKILTAIGGVIAAIGVIIYIVGVTQVASIADDRMLVDGQRNFEFELGGGAVFDSVLFLHDEGVDCDVHLDSLSIVHVDTNTVEALSFTCFWGGTEPIGHNGQTLYELGQFFAPEGGYGAFAVTSSYPTWVVDASVTHAQINTVIGGTLMGLVGSVVVLVGLILWCVACCCCCMAGQQAVAAQAPPTYGQAPPTYGQAPPTYQGGAQGAPVVVVGQPMGNQQCAA
mmetsp:Transcript_51250/g.122837  ORF Transcript_51250/g.122837 Transcript_51250/m.122837 type:complete len:236 (-) Transcript_51250:74-781(-)